MTEGQAYERLFQRTLVYARFAGRVDGILECGQRGICPTEKVVEETRGAVEILRTELLELEKAQKFNQVCAGSPNVSY